MVAKVSNFGAAARPAAQSQKKTRELWYFGIIVFMTILLIFTTVGAIRGIRMQKAAEASIDDLFIIDPRPNDAALRPRPLKPADILRPRKYVEYQKDVNECIDRAFELGDFGPPSALKDACKQAMTGGKRIRAVILLEIVRAQSVAARTKAPLDAAEIALFIEYLHNSSLVIDDMPAFDNDAERRGKPSVHASSGTAVAQMAAVSLLGASFESVCRQVDWVRKNMPGRNIDRVGAQVCSIIGRSIGSLGAAGGQFMELAPDFAKSGDKLSAAAIEDIAIKKTASLFELSFVVGWLMSGGDPAVKKQIHEIGRKIGLAFQIADDIGDMEKDAARVGPGRPEVNYANVLGRDRATTDMNRHLADAKTLMARHQLWTPLFEQEIYPMVRKMAVN